MFAPDFQNASPKFGISSLMRLGPCGSVPNVVRIGPSRQTFPPCGFLPVPYAEVGSLRTKSHKRRKAVNQQQTRETWVISRTDEGFRVYSPADPTKSHIEIGRASC